MLRPGRLLCGLFYLLPAVIACHAGAPPGRAPASSAAGALHNQGAPMTIPDTPATRLVRRLVERRPARMSELEAVVGPIEMSFRDEDHENMGWLHRPRDRAGEHTALVPLLDVRYRFDMYHETPSRPRDVSLQTFTLEIRGDAAAAEQILRDQLGPPRAVADGGTPYAAFHPFYLARLPRAPDRFRLAWYAQVPRFAIPEPDPVVRAAWLRALADQIAIARSVDELDAFCRSAPPGVGVEIVGTLNRTANPYGLPAPDPRDYWIKLVPPVRAKLLAEAFSWGPIVGVSHGVHMASWHIERRDDTWLPISGATAQWQIEASFDRSPSGGPAQRPGPAASGVSAVGPDDEIQTLAIEPRFK